MEISGEGKESGGKWDRIGLNDKLTCEKRYLIPSERIKAAFSVSGVFLGHVGGTAEEAKTVW